MQDRGRGGLVQDSLDRRAGQQDRRGQGGRRERCSRGLPTRIPHNCARRAERTWADGEIDPYRKARSDWRYHKGSGHGTMARCCHPPRRQVRRCYTRTHRREGVRHSEHLRYRGRLLPGGREAPSRGDCGGCVVRVRHHEERGDTAEGATGAEARGRDDAKGLRDGRRGTSRARQGWKDRQIQQGGGEGHGLHVR